jgi:colanic acid/amylovoran biosynthesis glycosyltransferase
MPTIGYLVPEFPSQTHAFFWREVGALRELGATVHLLSTTRPDPSACRHEFAARATAETEYLFPAGWKSFGYLLRHPVRALKAVGYVLKLRETSLFRRMMLLGLIPSAAHLVRHARSKGLDHLHIHSCANSAHLGALGHILGDLPYSLTLHGDMPVYGTDHAAKMRCARFVACVTRPLHEQVIAAIGLAPERVPVIWMGVDMGKFHGAGSRVSRPGYLRAITVARLTWPKGHRFAVAALRQLKERGVEVSYVIAGEGPYRQGIVDEVNSAGMADEVRLLPSIGLGEAAPVAVMEAMASGLPVITSIIGGTPDMIDHGIDGFLCEKEDAGAIARHLEDLAHDPGLRARIGEAARKRAARDFDARTLAGRLLALVNEGEKLGAATGPV